MKTLKKGDSVQILGKRWFQKGNGNTYHSVDVYVNNEFVEREDYAYGYGSQYEQTGMEILKKHYSFPKELGEKPSNYEIKEYGIKILSNVSDVSRKKDLEKGGSVKSDFWSYYASHSAIITGGSYLNQMCEGGYMAGGGFIDDKEKMIDFKEMTKKDFLDSYSYLTEAEYDETAKEIGKKKVSGFIDDKEKMADFMDMTKKDFLASYSYLTEAEYDETAKEVSENKVYGGKVGGSGWGDFKKGKRITDFEGVSEGDILLEHGNQFNTDNVVLITEIPKGVPNTKGKIEIVYGKYVDPKNTKKLRSNAHEEGFSIWDFKLKNDEYYLTK